MTSSELKTLAAHVMVLAVMLCAPERALGVGVLMTEGTPQLVRAHGVMAWGDEEIRLHLDLDITGDGEDALWILPLPEGATVIDSGELPMTELTAWGSPRVTYAEVRSDAGCGDPSTSIEYRGPWWPTEASGAWREIGVLKSPTLESLTSWIEEQGFGAPEDLEARIGPSLLDGDDVIWGVLRAPYGVGRLTGLEASFRRPANGKQDLMLGPVEPSGGFELLLHVLGDTRYRVENSPETSARLLFERASELDEDKDEIWGKALQSLAEDAGGRVVLTEAALHTAQEELEELGFEEPFPSDAVLSRLRLWTSSMELHQATVAYANDGPEVPAHTALKQEDLGAWIPAWLALLMLFGVRLRARDGV